jgi:hypothetical protein
MVPSKRGLISYGTRDIQDRFSINVLETRRVARGQGPISLPVAYHSHILHKPIS